MLAGLMDIVMIKGSIASNIKEKNSSLLSPFIVFMAAIFYGFASYYSGSFTDTISNNYLLAYFFFSYLFMVASQLGLTLLLWAMGKIFQGKSRFMSVFIAVGYTFLPYGILTSTHSYYTSTRAAGNTTNPVLILILIASILYFTYLLAKVLRLLENFSQTKALSSIIIGFIFFGSFIYLFGY